MTSPVPWEWSLTYFVLFYSISASFFASSSYDYIHHDMYTQKLQTYLRCHCWEKMETFSWFPSPPYQRGVLRVPSTWTPVFQPLKSTKRQPSFAEGVCNKAVCTTGQCLPYDAQHQTNKQWDKSRYGSSRRRCGNCPWEMRRGSLIMWCGKEEKKHDRTLLKIAISWEKNSYWSTLH
jgi:hypothetical protein